MMFDDLAWISCDGGPHLFVPRDLAALWRSTDAEYAAACAVGDPLGVIPIQHGCGLVLGGDVPLSVWVPAGAFGAGTLVVPVVWEEELTSEDFLAMVSGVPATAYADTGLVLSSATDGFLHFAACDHGPAWVYATVEVPLSAGSYRLLTTEAEVGGYRLCLHALDRCA